MNVCYEAVKRQRSAATARTYSNGWKWFIKFLQLYEIQLFNSIDCIKIKMFIDFPEWLTAQDGLGKSSIQIYLAGVSHYLRWLTIHDYIDPSQKDLLKIQASIDSTSKKFQRKRPFILEDEAVDKIIEAVRSIDSESPMFERNIALVIFLASSGVRNAEACALKIADLDMKKRRAIIRHGKGDKERDGLFNQEAADALRDYWTARGWGINGKDPVFARHDKGAGKTEDGLTRKHEAITTATARNILKSISDLAGVHVHPHLLRHWFATQLYQKTRDIRGVQKILGHSSSRTTEIYADPDMEQLEKEYRETFEKKM